LVRQFPTVSVFDVDAILKQIREIMDRASLAVQYVFLFTLVAGIVVLLAAVQSTRDERRYESAMLRTLGASRGTVLQGVAAEFSALGFLSGTLAALRRQWGRLGARPSSVLVAVRPRSLGVGAGLVLRHDSRWRERHAGDAWRGQYAAHGDVAGRSPSRGGGAARRVSELRESASLQGWGCRWHGTECASMRTLYAPIARPVVLKVRRNSLFESLSTLFNDQRAPLILLVDDHAKLRGLGVGQIDVHIDELRCVVADRDLGAGRSPARDPAR
jgi:hypothetical protein